MRRTKRIEIRVNEDEIDCIKGICLKTNHSNFSDMFLNALIYYVNKKTDIEISDRFDDRRKRSTIKKENKEDENHKTLS